MDPHMSNGGVDDAKVEAILGGGQDRINRYVVCSLMVLMAEREKRRSISGFVAGVRSNVALLLTSLAAFGGLLLAILK